MATDRTPGAVAWMAAAAYRASQRSRRDRPRRCPWASGTAGSAWWSTRRRAGGGRCGGWGGSRRVLREVTAVLDAAGASYQVSESASLADAAAIAARAAGMGQVVVAVG